MKFVAHRRFRGLAACGQHLNIPYGRELGTEGNFIVTKDGKPICLTTSEIAKQYFACNDDGKGLRRGALTYAIAYDRRDGGGGWRFSEQEIKMLEWFWSKWLRQDTSTILFNEDFFRADPAELQQLADALHIKIRR